MQQIIELLARGDIAGAAALVVSARRQGVLEPEVAAAEAELHAAEGDFRQALASSDRALAAGLRTPQVLLTRSFTLLMLERFAEALEAVDALLIHNPAYPGAAWLRAGIMRRSAGDLAPQTLAAYDSALDIEPDNLRLQCEHADVLRAVGRYDEALAVYMDLHHRATRDPDLLCDVTFSRGCVEMVLGDNDAALVTFREVKQMQPHREDIDDLISMLAD